MKISWNKFILADWTETEGRCLRKDVRQGFRNLLTTLTSRKTTTKTRIFFFYMEEEALEDELERNWHHRQSGVGASARFQGRPKWSRRRRGFQFVFGTDWCLWNTYPPPPCHRNRTLAVTRTRPPVLSFSGGRLRKHTLEMQLHLPFLRHKVVVVNNISTLDQTFSGKGKRTERKKEKLKERKKERDWRHGTGWFTSRLAHSEVQLSVDSHSVQKNT